jgi:hypothetical protein
MLCGGLSAVGAAKCKVGMKMGDASCSVGVDCEKNSNRFPPANGKCFGRVRVLFRRCKGKVRKIAQVMYEWQAGRQSG